MGLAVTLVGKDSKDIEAVLRSGDVTLKVGPLSELTTLAQPATAQPDVVVLDMRALTNPPPALTALKRQHPSTPVIVVSKTLEPELILAAMRAGANECLAEPVSKEALDEAVTRLAATREPRAAASQVFAIVGAKGGVGTTSLVVNVAATLARAATAGTLLVDLHLSRGDAALYLGVEPRFSVADALENIQKLDDAYFRGLVTRAGSRLDVLAAPETPTLARVDPPRIRALIDFASKHFEYTVLDVPRTESHMLDALEGVKSIVVVTTQELPSVRSAASLAARLRQKYGKDKVQVVMSRLDKQSEISAADIEKVLGAPIAHTLPNDYRVVLQSLNTGRPLVLDNHTGLAASFETFARSLAGLKTSRKPGAAGAQKPAGWLGRLTGRG